MDRHPATRPSVTRVAAQVPRRPRWSLVGLISLTLLGGTRGDAQSVVQRDSAGVRVIDVAPSLLNALPTWRLEGPTVRIEPGRGGLEYEFNNAGSPWRLADGRIVVANSQVELRSSTRRVSTSPLLHGADVARGNTSNYSA
jgi:hypothetical protein